jgi:hypothetical protein
VRGDASNGGRVCQQGGDSPLCRKASRRFLLRPDASTIWVEDVVNGISLPVPCPGHLWLMWWIARCVGVLDEKGLSDGRP